MRERELRAGRGEGQRREGKSKKEARKHAVEGGGRDVGLAGFRTDGRDDTATG